MAAARRIKQNTISAIFFDLDNTLIQTRKADSKACNKLAEFLHDHHGLQRDIALNCTTTYLKAFRLCPDNPEWNLDNWRLHLWSQSLPKNYSHLCNDIYMKWLHLRYKYLAMSDEVVGLIQDLRRQYLLCLITNGPSAAQWEKIQRLNLSNLFDCILVSGDLPWEKPNQKIFTQACTFLGVEPKHCIMVGDKLETDIQGGIEADFNSTVWLPLEKTNAISSATDEEEIIPDFTLFNILDLPNILPANNQRTNNYRSRSLGKQMQNGESGPNFIQNRRVQSLPDLEDSNSNGSDGS